jgi:hypothetical protein
LSERERLQKLEAVEGQQEGATRSSSEVEDLESQPSTEIKQKKHEKVNILPTAAKTRPHFGSFFVF